MNIPETLFEENIRVEDIFWMSGLSDQPPSNVKDFLEEHDIDEINTIFGTELSEELDGQAEEILTSLLRREKYGFVVRAATPVPIAVDENMCCTTYGFGMSTFAYFYTDTLDEVFVEKLIKWKNDYIARKKVQLDKEAQQEASE